MRVFPTVQKLHKFFNPSHWGYCLTYQPKCLEQPCIRLRDVDACYETRGVANTILMSQYHGIYNLSSAKEKFTTDAARIAADLFLGLYGNRCTLYEMMLYFGKYSSVYKSSYYQFDVQDILKQFGAKYLPWLTSQCVQPEENYMEETGTVKGEEARNIWIEDIIKNGNDIRQGGLYRFGLLSEDEVVRVERQLNLCDKDE